MGHKSQSAHAKSKFSKLTTWSAIFLTLLALLAVTPISPAQANTATIADGTNNCQIAITSASITIDNASTSISLVGTRCIVKFLTVGAYTITMPAGVAALDYLVVGGGGGGGSGGGGAGGVLQGTNFSVTAGNTYSVSVGSGGAGGSGGASSTPVNATSGGSSIFASVAALGGGSGGQGNQQAGNGASGGGSRYDCTNMGCIGLGTAGQGTNGAASTQPGYGGGAGGGGAGGAGGNTILYHIGGKGGDGVVSSITGTATYYGGGGGGGINSNDNQYCGLNAPGTSNANKYCNGNTPVTTGGGAGGLGGGGRGSSWGFTGGNRGDISIGGKANGTAGTPNTGGGGGGVDPEDSYAYAGGSGVVILSYVSPANFRAVTFDSNNGSGATSTQWVQSNVATALQTNPYTYTGYVFQGWNTQANGSGTSYANLANLTTASAITLYAQWTAGVTKTVSFNANGGSGSQADQIAGQATNLNANQLSRSGYTFTGWNTAANGTGYSYLNQAVYSFAQDATLYAQWAVIVVQRSVSFYGNGATSGSTSSQVSSSSQPLTLNGFSRTGYNFLGWNTSNSAGSATYQDGQNYSFSADLSLYAIWVAQAPNVITYNGNGSTSGTVANQTASSNTLLNSNAFQRTGYTFLNWNTAANGLGVNYQSNYTYSFAASITLYAIWGQNFSVSYDGNGNSGGSVPQSQDSFVGGATITLQSNSGSLVKTGYLLTGWNTAANGSGTAYALGQANTRFNAAVTLYAQWTGATYVVLYTANGSTSGTVPALQTYTYGSAGITLRANTGSISRTGYTFVGWNTAPDGTGTAYVVSAAGVTFAQDTVLFAQWNANQTTINYTYNGSDGGQSIASEVFSTGAAALTLPSPTKTGFTFGGWYSDSSFTNLVGIAGAGYSPSTAAANINLFAKWIVNTYTVSYDYNGADAMVWIASASYSSGDAPLQLPMPTRANFHFDGWFDAPTGGTLVALGSATLVPSASRTLFARWTQNSLFGIGASTKIGSLTVSNGLGTQYTATGSNNSVMVDMPSGSLPDGTTLDIYLLSDSSTGRSLVSGSASFLVNLVVAWLATDGSVPTTAAGKPVVVTINDPAIKAGASIYQLMNGVAQLVGTATQNGVAQVSITDDPQLVVAATVATAPLAATALATDGAATVTWSAPASSGGADISGYVVTASTGQTCTTATLSCTFTGLTNGTAVTFTVRALNAVGSGSVSAASASVTPVGAQGSVSQVPQVPVVTAPSIGQLTLPPLTPGTSSSGQLSGVGLDQLQSITIGGKPATLTITGSTSATIAVPALSPGVYDLNYTMANGQTGVIPGGLTVPATSQLPVGVTAVTANPAAATVSVALPVDTSSDPSRVAVLQIFDAKGKLVQTLTQPVGANATDATFAIPANLAGYKVVAYTQNQFGVSAGAPIAAALTQVVAPATRLPNGNATVAGTIVAPAISFAADSAALPKSATAAIQAAAAFVKTNGGKLVITGFTSLSAGSATAAQKLATQRALAVAVALRKLGVNVWMNYSGAGPFNNKTANPANRKAVISWMPIVG